MPHPLAYLAARRRPLAWGLTGMIAVIVGIATLLPMADAGTLPGTDKLHHVLAFAALVLPAAMLAPVLLWSLLPILAVYGSAIEILQPFVGRHGDINDAFADLAGLFLGSALGISAHQLIKRHPAWSGAEG